MPGETKEERRDTQNFNEKKPEKIESMNCALLKYLQEQHNQSVTLPQQGVYIFLTKWQDQHVLMIIIHINHAFNLK